MIVAGLILSSIFAGLALWVKKKPFPAVVSALAIYVLLLMLVAVEDPSNLIRGVLFKVLIIAALVRALKAVMAAEKVV